MLIQVGLDEHRLTQLPATALVGFQQGEQPYNFGHRFPFGIARLLFAAANTKRKRRSIIGHIVNRVEMVEAEGRPKSTQRNQRIRQGGSRFLGPDNPDALETRPGNQVQSFDAPRLVARTSRGRQDERFQFLMSVIEQDAFSLPGLGHLALVHTG